MSKTTGVYVAYDQSMRNFDWRAYPEFFTRYGAWWPFKIMREHNSLKHV